MKCFPRASLYMDPDDDQPGLGMICLSDRCQEEKWAKLHRALTLGGDTAVAAEGLLLRAARLCNKPIIAGHKVQLEAVDTEYFARSLLDWGATAGRALAFGGPDSKGTVHELLSTIITDEPALSQQLVALNAVTLGDLTEITEVDGQLARCWVSKKKLRGAKPGVSTENADTFASILSSIPVPNGPITIRV